MIAISSFANGFMHLFEAGGETLAGWVTGIIPQVVCLMTAINAIIKIIGEEKVEKFCSHISGNFFCRYLVLPVIATICVTSPMCFSFGRFVEERYKPAYYDACVSFVHPVTGLFPHANAGELFVYMGIASGIQKLGLPLSDLAVRYFIVGMIVMLIRGFVTERIFSLLTKK